MGGPYIAQEWRKGGKRSGKGSGKGKYASQGSWSDEPAGSAEPRAAAAAAAAEGPGAAGAPSSRWAPTRSGNTALHRAAREGDAEELRRLLSRAAGAEEVGAMLRAANKYGATALHSAASSGHEECCRALLHYASPEDRRGLLEAESGRGNTAQALAVVGGHDRCAAALRGLAQELAEVEGSAADRRQVAPCQSLLQPEGSQPLVVYVHNLLARGFTNHNKKQHGADEVNSLESADQTRGRYEMSSWQLLSRQPPPDVALFQECEQAYFDPSWNSLAKELQDQYWVYRCCWGMNSRTGGPNPGSAVLVKKGGSAVPCAAEATCIGGADTGGSSKVAALLPLQYQGKELLVVSAHITFVPPRMPPTDLKVQQRARHIQLISEAVNGHPAIIGGDFNCELGRKLDEVLAPLRGGPSAFTVVSPAGCSTGLDGGMTKAVQIDYVLASKELRARSSVVLGAPRSPWELSGRGAGVVCAASDHVPVCAEIFWR